MHRTIVYLSLGSNLGDRKQNLEDAFALLCGLCEDLAVSSIYETRPLYNTDQPLFLNTVVRGNTTYSPQKLLASVLDIERMLGRRRTIANGPRLIDIDILLYGDKEIVDKTLQIPHPLMTERQFVLIPLTELSPELRDPVHYRLYTNILADLEDQGVYTFSVWDYTQSPHDVENAGK